MTISARSNEIANGTSVPVQAAASQPILDRDRAIDAWIAELYQAAIRPEGWEQFLVSLAEALRLDPVVVVSIANDGRELRHFAVDSALERSALLRLAPNLHAARRLRTQLGRISLERRAGEQILDRLAVGLVVVDARARVITTNRPADQILALNDGLTQHNGLEASTAADTAAIRRAVTSVAEGEDGGAPRRLCLARPSGARPWLIEVTPVERKDAQSAATVVISDGERPPQPCPDALRTYYGLTPAEAHLATLLSAGLSLEEAAERRSVSRNTARGQLKRIFAKTQTNRQAALVRLVLCGPTGLATPD